MTLLQVAQSTIKQGPLGVIGGEVEPFVGDKKGRRDGKGVLELEPPDRILLDAVVRDFTADHPDFQAFDGHVRGLVASRLGADGKPVFRGGPVLTTKENFDQWYSDVPGVNRRYDGQLALTRSADGTYVYDNSNFFPIDGLGWDDSAIGLDGLPHNFYFTLTLSSNFIYQGGEMFRFRGDDDVWVFINGELAIDLGGVHNPIEGSVQVDNFNFRPGDLVEFRFFFAERYCCGSNFLLQTNIYVPDDRTTTAEPTTAEPTTIAPTTAEPTTAEPTTAEPTTAELTTAEPTTAEPTTAEPTTAEATTAEPTTVEPTTAEPTTAEPTTAEPTTAEPTTAEPPALQSTTMEPTTMEPTTAEPTTAEPTTAEPTTAEPTTAEPTTAEPPALQSTTVEPTTAEPTTMGPTTAEPTTAAPPARRQPTTTAAPTTTVSAAPRPVGTCVLFGDPHVSSFDRSLAAHGAILPLLGLYESGDFWIVKSDDVHIQGRYGLVPGAIAGQASLLMLSVGGPFLGGHTLVIRPEYDVSPKYGFTPVHGGFRKGKVTWDGDEVLKDVPSEFSVDGLVNMSFVGGDQDNLIDRRLWYLPQRTVKAQLPLSVELSVNRWPSHIDAVVRMSQLPGGQEGHCGNFNLDPSDDAQALFIVREVSEAASLLGPRPVGAQLMQEEPPRPEDCPPELRARAEKICRRAEADVAHEVPSKPVLEACVFDVCFGGVDFAAEDAVVQRQALSE